MNLFLAGVSDGVRVDAGAAERALRDLHERLPFLPGAAVETWVPPSGAAAVVSVSHDRHQAGGVRYVHRDESRLALFSGRPIRWTGAREADGRGPIDAASYLEPAERWAHELDGRFAVVRYDDASRVLEAVTDPMGAYPLFEARADGVRWVSNSAELLRSLSGSTERDRAALAGLLGGGWSLDGHPLWASVRRLARASVHRLAAATAAERRELGTGRAIPASIGGGFDPDRAADLLVAATRALADWPGRPSVVPVTGGRDSRVVLGAALRAGIPFETTTGGADGSPDVQVGRALAEATGVRHSLIQADPHGSVWDDWRRAAEIVQLTSSGTSSLADAAGFPLGARGGPLPLWHSGQGGEIARSYYGTGHGLDRDGLVDRLTRAFLGRRPGRVDVLSREGRALVRGQIGSWVDGRLAAGAAEVDVPDLFYLERRMGTWAGPSHGCVEYVRDTTSPLWSARLLPDELGLPAHERSREVFHLRVLERLAPELVDLPFEDRRSWPARRSVVALRADRARGLAAKVAAEVRRRAAIRRPGAGAPDPFGPILAEIRAAVLAQPDHPAWPLLDRPRVETLLASPPARLDTMSRYYAWRLATVFGAPEPA